jgi:hypothetical protein
MITTKYPLSHIVDMALWKMTNPEELTKEQVVKNVLNYLGMTSERWFPGVSLETAISGLDVSDTVKKSLREFTKPGARMQSDLLKVHHTLLVYRYDSAQLGDAFLLWREYSKQSEQGRGWIHVRDLAIDEGGDITAELFELLEPLILKQYKSFNPIV